MSAAAAESGESAEPVVDTIVATSTAAGPGERAIVRLSGPRAHAIVATLMDGDDDVRPGHLSGATWDLGDGLTLPVELIGFRAPRSYTGEDLVEVHLRGWPALVTRLLGAAVAAGARPAARGEFTRRALVSGRIDMGQALAVARLATARDVEEAGAAAAVLNGALDRSHDDLREKLLAALALIEAHVDFEEEDTEAVEPAHMRAAILTAADAAADTLAATAALAPSDGETDVVLLGAPNVGKSQLLLALCPGAITTVSPRAGTTRDRLEAHVERDGRRWRLLDGPGIDPDHPELDELDRQAMEAFLTSVPPAAVVLHVLDAERPGSAGTALPDGLGARAVVTVVNKCDRLTPGSVPVPAAVTPGTPGGVPAPAVRTPGAPGAPGSPLFISALQGTGLPALWQALAAAAPAPRAPDLIAQSERAAVEEVAGLLQDTASLEDASGALPVVSLALRDALAALDGVVGRATDVDEEVLDRVFSAFCVGK